MRFSLIWCAICLLSLRAWAVLCFYLSARFVNFSFILLFCSFGRRNFCHKLTGIDWTKRLKWPNRKRKFKIKRIPHHLIVDSKDIAICFPFEFLCHLLLWHYLCVRARCGRHFLAFDCGTSNFDLERKTHRLFLSKRQRRREIERERDRKRDSECIYKY